MGSLLFRRRLSRTLLTGIYCGPLRLLAWEIAQRMNKAKVPCDLITGQEREEVDGAKHKAVTVEMADVTSEYSCAVVDEIQMLGCRTRGFSFTRALLGIAADELHLCGDAAAVPLIQEILKATEDNVKVQYYERLSPLVPLKLPLGSFANIRNGDCIVAFSRFEIYKIKRQIERERKHLCSVVYGSLPPETRTRQATMFNDENSDFDVLVASDAIGMQAGLFPNFDLLFLYSRLHATSGLYQILTLHREMFNLHPGCFRIHLVPTVDSISTTYMQNKLSFYTLIFIGVVLLCLVSVAMIGSLWDVRNLVPEICDLQEMINLQILRAFCGEREVVKNYFIADCEQMMKVAAVIDELPINLNDKYLFAMSPVDMDDDISSQGLTQFAQSYSKTRIVRLKEIFTPGTLKVPKSHHALKELESIHKVLDLYVWLSFHLEDSFPDRELAASQKAICSMWVYMDLSFLAYMTFNM
ncbi:UNVERIFIED_CONTAM: ATP-dependent RNA helicase SUV3, mitochondrial [Sesamum calycinum]|uniref:ATP-dependent RNA helicase SUV3, mitochondrial n=1 Tax=Sesamum calycinum TaxID=2727403 RepID=A0AAW2IY61_9LAMI